MERFSQKTIEIGFYLLFIFVPLILAPWNYELFEFNKMLTVYFFTIVIVGAWLVKMVRLRRIIFHRSFWDIPLLIFLLSQVLSYLFSIDRHTSFWGYYSRFNGGLLSVICYLLLYWAFVSNMNRKNSLLAIHYLLLAAALVAAYGIAEHFGIDAQYWVQDVRNRVFSTLGQPNWLAAWLVALIPLTWALTLRQVSKIKYLCLFFILYTCLLFTRSRSGLFGFGVAFLVFWPLAFLSLRKKILPLFIIFSLIILVLSFLIGRDWILPRLATPNPQPKIEKTEQQPPVLISESGDIRKIVWKGAIEIWRHHPVFGTGPETFAYSYYWYRPREHNDVSEWDFLYNKAHNEYLNYAATTGTFGLGAYLLLIGWYLVSGIRYQVLSIKYLKTRSSPDTLYFILYTGFIAGFTSILVTNFFGFSVVPVSLLFFLLPTMTTTFEKKELTPKNYSSANWKAINYKQYAIMVLILLVTGYSLLIICNYWRADTLFASGEKLNQANKYSSAFNTLQQAVQIRAIEPVYHNELALSAANLAVLAEKEKNATLAAQLTTMAIAESNRALKISPYHLNFWKTQTKVFYRLGEIEEKYYQNALQSLLLAVEIAPTEPKIRYNLALIFGQLNQMDQAIKTLEETIALKPNYLDPRYALALYCEQEDKIAQAKEQLEYILKYLDPTSLKTKEKLDRL